MKRTLTIAAAVLGVAAFLIGSLALVLLFPELTGLKWSPGSFLLLIGLLLGSACVACLLGIYLVATRDELALLRAIRDANRVLARNVLQMPARLANASPATVTPRDLQARLDRLSEESHQLAGKQIQVGQNLATAIMERVLATQDGLFSIDARLAEAGHLRDIQKAILKQISATQDGISSIDARLAEADHLRNLQKTSATILEQVLDTKESLSSLEARRSDANSSQYANLEALVGLYATLPLKSPLAPLRGWAISPDCAAYLVSLASSRKPNLVLELGSGLSTVLMASALEKLGTGHIITLEQDSSCADHTLELLTSQGLGHRVTIEHSPLADVRLNDVTWRWYDLRAITKLNAVDLLFIDGPPSNTQNLARYPALPILADRLSENAVVVLDDARRDQEVEIVQRWKSEFPHFSYRYLSHERGTVEIQKLTDAKPMLPSARRSA